MDPTIAASVAIIVGAPILSSMNVSFGFVEHIATRLGLLLALIYSVHQGEMPGLIAFLAVFSLLIERNHEVLTKFPYQTPEVSANRGSMLAPTRILTEPTLPMKPDNSKIAYDSPENQEKADASDLRDNLPHLAEGPRSADAPAFYTSKGLLT